MDYALLINEYVYIDYANKDYRRSCSTFIFNITYTIYLSFLNNLISFLFDEICLRIDF